MPQDVNNIIGNEQVARLERLFLERLRQVAGKLYRQYIEDGTVRQEEADEEMMRYYTAKKSGLQVVYSYYAEQWDYFHRMSSAEDASFSVMLQQARSVFARLYAPSELNPVYYMEQLARYATSHSRWQALRSHFMRKWEKLLAEREYAYQQKHIESLCEDYFRMVKTRADLLQNKGKRGDILSSRLAWLQLTQSPEMRNMLGKLAPVISNSPVIRELNRILGRKKADEDRLYQALSGTIPMELLRSASRSDIVGITEGNNLNALLPIEYCYLSDEQLEHVFIRRYTENKLAVFDAVSRQRLLADASSRRGKDTSPHHRKGPFVVCVDTSGSMRGEREIFAKAVVLGLALLSDRLNRLCRVILFSDQTEVIELRNLYEDLPLLEDFLCRSFYGGSDMKCAMEEAVHALMREDFRYADLLWISDFEMEPLSPVMSAYLEMLKQRNLRLYAVAMGDRYERSYLSLADRFWIHE